MMQGEAMLDRARVTRMRCLLDQAMPSEPPRLPRASSLSVSAVATGPLPRRALVKQLALAVARYGLQPEVDAYLAAAGCASLNGLEQAQLERIAAWVTQEVDRMATACDSPDAPPAR